MLKGKLVVGQSGGPTQVINNSLVGVIEEALAHQAITGIYGSVRGISGVLNEQFVDLARESRETLALLRHTPGAALGTVRYKLVPEDYGRIVETLRAHDVRFFCYIGGNDSMDTAHKVHLVAQEMGYDLCAIGVPKTVDNDLAHTDHCPGYGSAARFVALALRDSGRDTESMGPSSPVKIVEVMGRNAGWLTAASALGRQEPGDPPHLIYVPEHPVQLDNAIRDVERVIAEREHCVIALSEGAVSEAGSNEVDAFGHRMKGGAAEYLAEVIQERLGLKVRLDRPNYLQRSFSMALSSVDVEEAYRVGRSAVRLALDGRSDVMVTLERSPGEGYHCSTGDVPLAQVANAERLLPEGYIAQDGHDVTPAFVAYARPLIGEALPRLGRLSGYPISPRVGQAHLAAPQEES
jgi:6-phosphofructokinase